MAFIIPTPPDTDNTSGRRRSLTKVLASIPEQGSNLKLPLMSAGYNTTLIDRAFELERDRTELLVSGTKFREDLRQAQGELKTQGLALMSSETQVASLHNDLRGMFDAYQRQQESFRKEAERLQAALAAARSESEVLKVELMATQQRVEQRDAQLAARDAECDTLSADAVNLRRELEMWEGRAKKAERELAATQAEARLDLDRTTSRAEKAEADRVAAAALSAKRGEQLAAQDFEISRADDAASMLRLELQRLQFRAEQAETELYKTRENLKKSEELLTAQNVQIQTTHCQLDEVRMRECTQRVKIDQQEREHQEWIRRARLLEVAGSGADMTTPKADKIMLKQYDNWFEANSAWTVPLVPVPPPRYTPRQSPSLTRGKLKSAKARADELDDSVMGHLLSRAPRAKSVDRIPTPARGK
jgi:hypothetical protein